MNQPRCFTSATLGVALCLATFLAAGQEISRPPASTSASLESLLEQIRELRVSLKEIREELADSRQESQQLRRELGAFQEQLALLRAERAKPGAQVAGSASPQAGEQISNLAEEQQLLSGKVDDQYQTKVESGSKYRLRLSGLALLNVFSTRGAVDNLDVPGFARPKSSQDSNGSFGATARQSLLNLAVTGPEWRGARTSGDIAFDFFGGFPATREGVTAGLVRLRTARLNFDWPNTSVVAGQDSPFFSPLSPTSLASTAYPALSSAGNLWTWTPQVHVEHRIAFSDEDKLVLQWGILAPLTGEPPAGEYNWLPSAGERSRAPAYATRIAWQGAARGRPLSAGAGAYYSRQDWGFHRMVDAWAATADWELPLGRWFSLSGELYRGRAIAGLGGGAASSVLFRGSPLLSTSSVLPLNSAGGWSQLKFKPVERLEFNAAFGEDYPFRAGLSRVLLERSIEGSPAGRNAGGFLNVIYQARSNLLFSVEYHRLWTSSFYDPRQIADHVSVSSGIVF